MAFDARTLGAAVTSAPFVLLATLLPLVADPMTSFATETLTVTIEGLSPAGALPDSSALGSPDGGYGPNVNPAILWSSAPAAAKSYALLVVDEDVPADLSAVNKAGIVIAETAPRQPFYHFVLVDIPPTVTGIPAGAESRGTASGGKPLGRTSYGVRGQNDYARFFNGNPETRGDWGGYDGPFPPGNDNRIHRYVFRIFALDVPTLGLTGPFDGRAAEKALAGHVLAQGESVGTFTLNPALR